MRVRLHKVNCKNRNNLCNTKTKSETLCRQEGRKRCSLKRMFAMGLNRVFWEEGLIQACASTGRQLLPPLLKLWSYDRNVHIVAVVDAATEHYNYNYYHDHHHQHYYHYYYDYHKHQTTISNITRFVVIWKHFCFILSAVTRIRIDSATRPRSSSRVHNTSVSVSYLLINTAM